MLQELDRTVRQFRTREVLWPLHVPAQPILLDEIIARTLPGAQFDPLTLRSRTLLWLKWDDDSTWELWIIALPSGLKLYCDTSGDETRLLATGRRDSEIETDRLVLELLAESAGEHFGIEMTGGPPSMVRSPISNRSLVVDFFVSLFEVLGIEDDIRDIIRDRQADFRTDVETWLAATGFRTSDAPP